MASGGLLRAMWNFAKFHWQLYFTRRNVPCDCVRLGAAQPGYHQTFVVVWWRLGRSHKDYFAYKFHLSVEPEPEQRSHATNITQKLSLSRKNSNKPFKTFCKFLFGIINTKSLGRRRWLKTVIKLTEVKVLKSKLTPLRQQNTTVYILCSSECCEVFATLCNSFLSVYSDAVSAATTE